MKEIITCRTITGGEMAVPREDIRFRASVYAIIIRDGKLLITEECGKWTFPGGGVEIGETLQNALHREAQEEIGATVSISPIAHVETTLFWLPISKCPVQSIMMYFCCDLTSDIPEECLARTRWVDIAELEGKELHVGLNAMDVIRAVLERSR